MDGRRGRKAASVVRGRWQLLTLPCIQCECARNELEIAVSEQRGRRGIVAVRELTALRRRPRRNRAMESEARLVMIDRGLPPPELQYPIRGRDGELWRVDFAWPAARLAAEYESIDWHAGRDAMLRDKRRLGHDPGARVDDDSDRRPRRKARARSPRRTHRHPFVPSAHGRLTPGEQTQNRILRTLPRAILRLLAEPCYRLRIVESACRSSLSGSAASSSARQPTKSSGRTSSAPSGARPVTAAHSSL